MWIKLMGRDGVQRQLITTASSVTGPYRFQKLFRPLGMSCGDFDLVLEPSDRKAYFYFERVHSEMICADLTEDYCDVTGYYSTHFVCHRPPFVREAPAYFKRGYLHYLITSGTTGYFPNKSEVALAKSFHGPWSVVGDPHPDDPEGRSFRSQISSVFKHPHKKDLYIALGDRWLSDLPESLPNVDAVFDEAYQAHPPQYDVLNLKLEGLSAMDTSKATHIWLPLRFEGERPFIDWKEEWSIEDYE